MGKLQKLSGGTRKLVAGLGDIDTLITYIPHAVSAFLGVIGAFSFRRIQDLEWGPAIVIGLAVLIMAEIAYWLWLFVHEKRDQRVLALPTERPTSFMALTLDAHASDNWWIFLRVTNEGERNDSFRAQVTEARGRYMPSPAVPWSVPWREWKEEVREIGPDETQVLELGRFEPETSEPQTFEDYTPDLFMTSRIDGTGKRLRRFEFEEDEQFTNIELIITVVSARTHDRRSWLVDIMPPTCMFLAGKVSVTPLEPDTEVPVAPQPQIVQEEVNPRFHIDISDSVKFFQVNMGTPDGPGSIAVLCTVHITNEGSPGRVRDLKGWLNLEGRDELVAITNFPLANHRFRHGIHGEIAREDLIWERVAALIQTGDTRSGYYVGLIPEEYAKSIDEPLDLVIACRDYKGNVFQESFPTVRRPMSGHLIQEPTLPVLRLDESFFGESLATPSTPDTEVPPSLESSRFSVDLEALRWISGDDEVSVLRVKNESGLNADFVAHIEYEGKHWAGWWMNARAGTARILAGQQEELLCFVHRSRNTGRRDVYLAHDDGGGAANGEHHLFCGFLEGVSEVMEDGTEKPYPRHQAQVVVTISADPVLGSPWVGELTVDAFSCSLTNEGG